MDSTIARAGAPVSHPRSTSSVAGNVNSSCSIAPPPRYAMLVRLMNGCRWIAIRQVTPARSWKLVKVPRVPRSVILSIFSSSVNRREWVADNQQWPPLGWRARVGQDDRLEASATVKGLHDPLPIADLGIQAVSEALARRLGGPCGDGGVGDRTLTSIGRAEPSGDSNSRLDRDIDRQPLSSQRTSR
jgi:hypothetical protein